MDDIDILNKTRERLSSAEEVLKKVLSWADAYPDDVFPEPDIALCARVLSENGQSIDCLAAHARRGAIEWIGSDVRKYFYTYKDGQP